MRGKVICCGLELSECHVQAILVLAMQVWE